MQDRLAPPDVPAVALLRSLRDQPGLAALLGDWPDDVIAFRPTAVLDADEDPFAALAGTAALGTAPSAVDDAEAWARAGATGAKPSGDGVWIGYLGYQLARAVETLPPSPPRPTPLPGHHLARYDHLLRRDEAAGWLLESRPGADPGGRAAFRDAVEDALRMIAAGDAAPRRYRCGPFGSDVTGAAHAGAVTAALRHIRDGDVYQVNVCRRLSAAFDGDPLDLFCAGYEALTPRFGAFLRLPGGAVASLSPELFLRRTGRSVLTSPIKGTAPLATDPAALAASAKNRAENIMIVDLMRNDLGRVCAPGTVEVENLARVQPHTGVHHLVSDVRGTLRDGVTDGDLLRATFPPGSCTGAPKVRAMEIVNELERTAREVYTGAVGHAGPDGLTMNVAIRTFEFAGGTVWLGAGGGVVADSDPADEAHETLVKARPLLDAVGARFDGALTAEWRARGAASPVPGPETVPEPEPEPHPAVPPSRPDPALGVFTTALVEGGHVVDLEAHLRRLGDSTCTCYGLPLPPGLREDVASAAAGLRGRHRLRVSVTPAGTGAGAEHRITATALPNGPEEPWRLVPVRLPGGLGAHKWNDRRPLAGEPGTGLWSPTCDPLLVEPDGEVLEAGRANVFAVVDHGVVTPAADGRILPGLMRARVLAALRGAGIPVREGRLTLDDLASAEEVFVTNSVVGTRAVTAVDGVGTWAPGPLQRALQDRVRLIPQG